MYELNSKFSSAILISGSAYSTVDVDEHRTIIRIFDVSPVTKEKTMRRRIRPFMLAATLISLAGLAPVDGPRRPSENSCEHYYYGQCLPPEYLTGFVQGSVWQFFPH